MEYVSNKHVGKPIDWLERIYAYNPYNLSSYVM